MFARKFSAMGSTLKPEDINVMKDILKDVFMTVPVGLMMTVAGVAVALDQFGTRLQLMSLESRILADVDDKLRQTEARVLADMKQTESRILREVSILSGLVMSVLEAKPK